MSIIKYLKKINYITIKLFIIIGYEMISTDIIGSVPFTETDIKKLLYLCLYFNKGFKKNELDYAIIFIYGFYIFSHPAKK